MSTTFEPLDEKTIFEKIVDLLKQKIFSGEFQPGDRLPAERELAETLRVSRLSVREAYRALVLFGIVEIRRGHAGGAFIRVPPRETIFQSVSDFFRLQGVTLEEWVEARLHLELDISRLAATRASGNDYDRLEEWITKAFARIKKGVPAHHENIRFHQCLSEIAGNRILHTAYCSIMELELTTLKVLSVGLEQSREVAMEHINILSALKTRDIEKLSKVVEAHVSGSSERLILISEKSPLFNNHPAGDGSIRKVAGGIV